MLKEKCRAYAATCAATHFRNAGLPDVTGRLTIQDGSLGLCFFPLSRRVKTKIGSGFRTGATLDLPVPGLIFSLIFTTPDDAAVIGRESLRLEYFMK